MATYYIDPVNGTDSFTGLEITGTIDSVTDTTHFVDAALTGGDDYINGSFLYNETTGAGTLIADFTTADDTVTLTDADASMQAGDTYYILHAFLDLDQFTENARSAGDICIVRRGGNQCDDGTDLTFSSSGTVSNPIIIEADYANKWRDDVDLSATGTATLTFGSKTITFSADISSVCAAGDWIYVASEDAKGFAYEVDSVSTVTVTLFLPYKGAQAGSGKTMTNMQAPPTWNTTAGNFQWNFDSDNYWQVQGIHIRGTDSNGNVEIDTAGGHIFKDVIFEGNGSGDVGIRTPDDTNNYQVYKSRFFNHINGVDSANGAGWATSFMKDCLFDGNSVAGSEGIFVREGDNRSAVESEFKNYGSGDLAPGDLNPEDTHRFLGRNLILSSTTEIDRHDLADFCTFTIEDYDGTVGDNRLLNFYSTAEGTPILQSETSTVRSGGSTISIKFTPSTKLSTNWEYGRIKLFELPIYATTDSKTYTIYFASDDNTDWDADPTASELWIELEAWGHASNNFRQITKSTGTVDFSTDTDFDQTLTVTVAPAQAGVAYLRCYYAKTKEATNANIFYCDPLPEIS